MGGQRFLVPQYEAPAHDILSLRARENNPSKLLKYHKPLQVLPFRKINRHGMIRRTL